MKNIPVLFVSDKSLAVAYEKALLALHKGGIRLNTQYDKPGDPLHDLAGRRPARDFPWYINVCRRRVLEAGAESSAWSPTGQHNFHDTMKFGKLYIK